MMCCRRWGWLRAEDRGKKGPKDDDDEEEEEQEEEEEDEVVGCMRALRWVRLDDARWID